LGAREGNCVPTLSWGKGISAARRGERTQEKRIQLESSRGHPEKKYERIKEKKDSERHERRSCESLQSRSRENNLKGGNSRKGGDELGEGNPGRGGCIELKKGGNRSGVLDFRRRIKRKHREILREGALERRRSL